MELRGLSWLGSLRLSCIRFGFLDGVRRRLRRRLTLSHSAHILRNRKQDGYPTLPAGIPSAINYGRDRLAGKDVKDPWFAEKYPPGEQDWGVSSFHGERPSHSRLH